MKEVQPHIPLLSSPETHPSILLIHPHLHHPPHDDVRAGSSASHLGSLLRIGRDVLPQHSPYLEIFPFIIPYLLFENTMSVTKFNAMISGLFQLSNASEWAIMKKSIRSSEGDLASFLGKEPNHHRRRSAPELDSAPKEVAKKKHSLIYRKELALSFFF